MLDKLSGALNASENVRRPGRLMSIAGIKGSIETPCGVFFIAWMPEVNPGLILMKALHHS